MTKLLTFLSGAAVVGGFLLALSGAGVIAGIALVLLGFAVGAALGALAIARSVHDSIREWVSLVTSGPESLRVVALKPPQGIFFNRNASVTLEVRGRDGTVKHVQRGLPVPPLQAFLWRVMGWVPTPLRKLTRRRELDLTLYRKRTKSP
jgi:hypothetical protein